MNQISPGCPNCGCDASFTDSITTCPHCGRDRNFFQFSCSNCDQPIEIPRHSVGTLFPCPNCQVETVAPEPQQAQRHQTRSAFATENAESTMIESIFAVLQARLPSSYTVALNDSSVSVHDGGLRGCHIFLRRKNPSRRTRALCYFPPTPTNYLVWFVSVAIFGALVFTYPIASIPAFIGINILRSLPSFSLIKEVKTMLGEL